MADYWQMSRGYMPQETTHNGYEKHSDGWSKPGFTDGYEDHIYKRSVVTCNPNDGCVIKTETIVEEVHVPAMNMYGNSSPAREGHMKAYGGVNNGWNVPVISPSDRQHKGNEYISGIQTEAGRPGKTGNTYWHETPNSYGHGGKTNYETVTNGYKKPSGWEPHHEGSHGRDEIAEGGFARQGRGGWTTPPTEITTQKHSVTMAPTQGRVIISKEETFPHTIDSREAARRFGMSSVPPQALKDAETYTPTIDSYEAAQRYSGQIL